MTVKELKKELSKYEDDIVVSFIHDPVNNGDDIVNVNITGLEKGLSFKYLFYPDKFFNNTIIVEDEYAEDIGIRPGDYTREEFILIGAKKSIEFW